MGGNITVGRWDSFGVHSASLNPTSAVGRRSVTDAQRSDDPKALRLARNGQECCEDSGLFALKTQALIL
jgi:hypothetical protein